MSSRDWIKAARWIWIPGYNDSKNNAVGRFVLFRKTFKWTLQSSSDRDCLVHVSADTRYRLYVNGKSISFGPCKSYPEKWSYETIDIGPFLVEGDNVLAAKVLRYSDAQLGSSSLMQTNKPGFMLHAFNTDALPSTNDTWRCIEDVSARIIPRSDWNFILGPPFLCNNEEIIGNLIPRDWLLPEYDDSDWRGAILQSSKAKMVPVLEPWTLHPRPIPMLPEVRMRFERSLKCTGGPRLEFWNNLLQNSQPMTIPANSSISVDLKAAVLTTGFLEFSTQKGTKSQVRLKCSECYEKDLGVESAAFPIPRVKIDRQDFENGRLYGTEDIFFIGGGQENTQYEPFWFRTFRFIGLQITTKDEPLTITNFTFRETHYPLLIGTKINATLELEKIWSTSLNTLKNCMHETYEDCPFYEQNQFAMDSRAQMLFTYQISRDDRLSRKAMEEFYASRGRRIDGLLETHFPCPFRGMHIPQFSLFWILMLHDHIRYFGDKALVRRYLGTVDGILHYFDTRINELGLVGRFDVEAWPFVDWVKEWQGPGPGIDNKAIPPAYHKTGAATYNSLIYAVALRHAADLCDSVQRPDTAFEYRIRADSINTAVRKHCYDGVLFLDGPGIKEFSQHAQVFAILAGAIEGEAAKGLFRDMLSNKELPRCSYAMGFYMFRAAEVAGVYEECFNQLLQPWRDMLAMNLTTWAEDAVNCRSDCHGWSSSPLYEITAMIFGVQPAEHGYSRLRLEPKPVLLQKAKGTFCTGKGEVEIEWSKETGLTVRAENDMTVDVVTSSETATYNLQAGVTSHILLTPSANERQSSYS